MNLYKIKSIRQRVDYLRIVTMVTSRSASGAVAAGRARCCHLWAAGDSSVCPRARGGGPVGLAAARPHLRDAREHRQVGQLQPLQHVRRHRHRPSHHCPSSSGGGGTPVRAFSTERRPGAG